MTLEEILTFYDLISEDGRSDEPVVEVQRVLIEALKEDKEQWSVDNLLVNVFNFNNADRLRHDQSVEMFIGAGKRPATIWPLACFGFLHHDYILTLNTPRLVVAPGNLFRGREDFLPGRLTMANKLRVLGDEKVRGIQEKYLQRYGEKRVGTDYFLRHPPCIQGKGNLFMFGEATYPNILAVG